LTTAQKFFGEEVLLDLLEEPEFVLKAMSWITEANIVLVRHFAELAGMEIREVHVGECSSCMVGAVEWEGFVSPTLERIGKELGLVRLHSCGPSNHLLASARKIKALGGLDLGGETSLARVRELFGRHFPVSIAPPVKLLIGGSLDALWEWTQNVLTDNQYGELVILYHLEPAYPPAVLQQWREKLLQSTSMGAECYSVPSANAFSRRD
jgi:uroporphyrinogen-III decarboxylase